MELYTLDSLLRRDQVVDRFESLIWTERFAEIGDFDLVIESTRETRNLFKKGVKLASNRSYRGMTVETLEDTTDDDGRAMLRVKGRSFEAILEDRVAKNTLANLTTEPEWVVSGWPRDVANHVFNEICRNGDLDLKDKIPFLQPGTIFPTGTIPEPSTPISVKLPIQTVYEAVRGICTGYDLGFRLIRQFDTSKIYFDIYTGNDLTTRQNVRTPVIFSTALDNLQNTKEFSTIQRAKNVAYVFSEAGSAVVYPADVDPSVEGFERRVLLVKADIKVGESDIPGKLQQKGLTELFKTRTFTAFDGELNQNSSYIYGVDYDLGDVVEMRNVDNVVSYKRVTEQIFVHDGEGERAYPTVSMDMFLSTNTWLSQLSTKNWTDFGTVEYWQDQ
jgi:hypothetical protein